MLIHKGCGGECVSDFSKMYEYHRCASGECENPACPEALPALRCKKCGVEITGDPQLEDKEREREP